MTSITQIVESIKSEIKVDSDGKGFVSIRGLARLLQIDEKALRYAFQGAEQNPSKMAEMLINKGFTGAEQKAWASVGIPDTAAAFITKYYAYKAGRYCSEYAELVDDVFCSMGVRTWFQQSAGYQPPTNQVKPDPRIAPKILAHFEDYVEQEKQFGNSRDVLRASKQLVAYLSTVLDLQEAIKLVEASIPKNLKSSKSAIDPVKAKIFEDMLKACKGQPKKIEDFRTHSLGRRLDVRGLYGVKSEQYLKKVGIITLFTDAAKNGYGSFDPVENAFKPSISVMAVTEITKTS